MASDALKQIEAVGCRLAAELRELIEQLPPEQHRVSDMARWLGLNRTTCHRVLAAARRGGDGLAAIREAPGVGGLRQWVGKVREHSADPSRVAAVEAAIDAYRAAVNTFGGSRSALLAKIDKAVLDEEHSGAGLSSGSSRQIREELFELYSRYLGWRCHAFVSIRVFRPMLDQPDVVEVAKVKGEIGIEADRAGMPLILSEYMVHTLEDHATPVARDLSGRPLDDPDANTLIAEFSSSPSPIETVRTYRRRVLTVLDPSLWRAGVCDVCAGTRNSPLTPDPATLDRPLLSMGLGTSIPSRYCIFDVYLHRSLARRSVPSVGVYRRSSASFGRGEPVERWYDRLPDPPTLEIINQDADTEVLKVYPRHAELTRYTFDRLGWPIGGFVGYRCLIDYPLWSAEYMMSFDFGSDAPPSPAEDAGQD